MHPGLAFVGNGNGHFAEAFQKDSGLTAPLYVDTRREAYQTLGMKRSLGATLASLSTLKSAARALRADFRQGSIQGEAWQLGGVLVVRPGGGIAYRYLSEIAGDHPPVAAVLAALPART